MTLITSASSSWIQAVSAFDRIIVLSIGVAAIAILGKTVAKALRDFRRHNSRPPTELSTVQRDAKTKIEPLLEFDWMRTAPTRYLPIKPVYHITMALQQDTPSQLITIDQDYLSRVTYRRRLIQQKPSTVHGCLGEGSKAVFELHDYLLRDYLPVRFPTIFRISNRGTNFENTVTGKVFPLKPPKDPAETLRILGETVEEDLFLLHETPNGHLCVAFMCCFPAHFDPSTKFGNVLQDIHKPVPSYNKIGASMERFFSKLQVGKSVKRLNWSIQTHAELHVLGNHEAHDGAADDTEMPIDVDKTFMRVELQTLSRLPKTRAILFSFKTYLYGIRQVKEEGSGPELADAIEGLKSGNAPVFGLKNKQGKGEELTVRPINLIHYGLAERQKITMRLVP